ncbi:MAG TPA: RNA-binding S4 domain-containing protein [Stellaceae bacterium]|nr:RNA-binding S4 domain-containing protein [Stellaceae bacterium]
MTGESLRLDKWLWFARMARTRSLAARLCLAGLVTVDGTVVQKPHHAVRVGDRIGVPQGRVRRQLVVLALGERRGSAPEARRLYAEPEPPAPLAPPAVAWTSLFEDAAADE